MTRGSKVSPVRTCIVTASRSLESRFCMRTISSQRPNLQPTSGMRPTSAKPNDACSPVEAEFEASIAATIVCLLSAVARSISAAIRLRPTPSAMMLLADIDRILDRVAIAGPGAEIAE